MGGKLRSIAGEYVPFYRYRGISGALAYLRSTRAQRARPERVSSNITSLQIEPTKFCNQHCDMCVNPTLKADVKGNMTFEEFKAVVDQFPYAYDVKLQGMGEIFMNPAIMDMIRYLNSRGSRVGFATNAMLFTDDIIRELTDIENLDVRFSIDTLDREKYRDIRGVDALEQVRENVTTFLRAREEAGKADPSWRKQISTQIRCVLTNENIGDLIDLITFAGEVGIEKVVISWVLAKKYSESQSQFIEDKKVSEGDEKVTRDAIKRAKDLAGRSNVELELLDYPDDIMSTCRWPWRMPYVTYDGYLMPCCNLEVPKPINLGNVLERSFDELWNGSDYVAFRRDFKDLEKNAFCVKCPFL